MEALRSRRDRNMDAKRARIFAAAHDLLQTHGYAGMTTQQVSDRADVAAGTLFRYAATKADLLLMVYNERFREAITEGRRAAAGLSDPIEAVFALVMPVLKGSAEQPPTPSSVMSRLSAVSPPPKNGRRYLCRGLAMTGILSMLVNESTQ